jgi:hypothetical protein
LSIDCGLVATDRQHGLFRPLTCRGCQQFQTELNIGAHRRVQHAAALQLRCIEKDFLALFAVANRKHSRRGAGKQRRIALPTYTQIRTVS